MLYQEKMVVLFKSATVLLKKVAKHKTNLTEVKIVRYADDFKLFCRDRASAEKMFKLVKIFLKDRLKLDISEKKSKIVNLRKGYSYFLGIKFKATKNRNKYTAKSFISEVATKGIQKMAKEQIKEIQKRPTAQAVLLFNSKIRGVQDYYRMATMVNIDFSKIGYIINRSLMTRLGNLLIRRIRNTSSAIRDIIIKCGMWLMICN